MIDSAILVAVLGGGVIALKLLWNAGDPAEEKAWAEAAERVGGNYTATRARLFRPAERRIELVAAGVTVVARTDVRMVGDAYEYCTRVTSDLLPAASETRLHCARRDVVLKLKQRLGLASLLTGDARFDDAFDLRGSPAAVVLALLDASTRRAVVACDAGFDLDGDASRSSGLERRAPARRWSG
jgi:hypothetical protein